MKRILIFSLAYFPRHVGGAEIAIKEITDRIDPEEYEYHMICLRFDSTLLREEQVGNVLVHRVGFGRKGAGVSETFTPFFYVSKILFIPLACVKAVSLNRKYKYDLLWSMMSYMVFPIVLLRLAGNRTPFVVTLQEGDPFQHVFERWFIIPFRPLLTFGFRRAKKIQVISSFLAVWAKQMGYPGEPDVIPNAVNTKHFSQEYSQEERIALEKKVGKEKGDIYLITTSRLVKKNAVDDVIRALSLLPANVKFLVLGLGPDLRALQELCAELRVSERVRFLGQIEHDEMPKYLKISDIFIRPSLSEGMGNSFVEAFASGIPVIATQEGGIADFLFDPVKNPEKKSTGHAVLPRHPDQIARAVVRILKNKEETRKITENAKRLAFEKYDWGKIAKDMRETLFKM